MMYPVGFDLAMDAARRNAQSALPDAPVVPDDPTPRGPARTRVRIAAAVALRALAAVTARAAERIEPRGYGVALPPGHH